MKWSGLKISLWKFWDFGVCVHLFECACALVYMERLLTIRSMFLCHTSIFINCLRMPYMHILYLIIVTPESSPQLLQKLPLSWLPQNFVTTFPPIGAKPLVKLIFFPSTHQLRLISHTLLSMMECALNWPAVSSGQLWIQSQLCFQVQKTLTLSLDVWMEALKTLMLSLCVCRQWHWVCVCRQRHWVCLCV